MSADAHGDAPHYNIRVHPGADRELTTLREHRDTDAFETCIGEVSRERQPKRHAAVEAVENDDHLLRVRQGDLRALCALAKPYLLVLAVGKRDTFYKRRLSVAQARLRDWDGGA